MNVINNGQKDIKMLESCVKMSYKYTQRYYTSLVRVVTNWIFLWEEGMPSTWIFLFSYHSIVQSFIETQIGTQDVDNEWLLCVLCHTSIVSHHNGGKILKLWMCWLNIQNLLDTCRFISHMIFYIIEEINLDLLYQLHMLLLFTCT